MHPQLFLRTFWRLELRPQIFVAMSFLEKYQSRFDDIITPAICSIRINDVQMKPYRVDISKSGDSILTDIMDGIAHSELILADVSSVGKDSETGGPYRNGNVMYEVGLALACRLPAEVLLIRDDKDKFLFDVSTIPHTTIDFTNKDLAIETLRNELMARLKERKYINDVRLQLAIASLTYEEAAAIRKIAFSSLRWENKKGPKEFLGIRSIPRLLDKQLMKLTGDLRSGVPRYELTPLGHIVANFLKPGKSTKNDFLNKEPA